MTVAAEWFVYDPDDNPSFFATEQEARDYAEHLLEEVRDDIDPEEGWPEDVSDICWGRVVGQVVQTKCKQCPDGESEWVDFACKTLPSDRTLRDVLLEALTMACPDTIRACVDSLVSERKKGTATGYVAGWLVLPPCQRHGNVPSVLRLVRRAPAARLEPRGRGLQGSS